MDAILHIRPNPVRCLRLELSPTVSSLLADLHSLVPPLDLNITKTLSQTLLCQPWEVLWMHPTHSAWRDPCTAEVPHECS